MKKLFTIILFAMIALTACSAFPKSGMSIKPSEFSAETKKILMLFDDEVQFFDISLDETSKSHTITVWVYRDGDWVDSGSIEGPNKFLSGQFAIKLGNNNFYLYPVDGNGHNAYRLNDLKTGLEKSTATGVSTIEKLTPLELNKETPIWVKIGNNTDTIIETSITDDFRKLECSAGIAITVTLSDKVID